MEREAGMADPVIDIRDLKKTFGALVVTDNVSINVAAGEIHALIGPNGAGKTTLIHQIGGTLQPASGSIRIGGVDMTGATPQARARAGLARTFQLTSIIPSISVLSNVALAVQAHEAHPLALIGAADRDERLNGPARAALAEVGLAERAQIRAGTLSHGEKRALEIAMALASGPRAILFDEPMAGMSREESLRIIGLLGRLKGRYAMLLIEHDMDAVFSLADRVSVLVYGRIIATGTPDEIRSKAEVKAAYIGEDEYA
jgi:branched-chain amino acid transport system ATP-binding protein